MWWCWDLDNRRKKEKEIHHRTTWEMEEKWVRECSEITGLLVVVMVVVVMWEFIWVPWMSSIVEVPYWCASEERQREGRNLTICNAISQSSPAAATNWHLLLPPPNLSSHPSAVLESLTPFEVTLDLHSYNKTHTNMQSKHCRGAQKGHWMYVWDSRDIKKASINNQHSQKQACVCLLGLNWNCQKEETTLVFSKGINVRSWLSDVGTVIWSLLVQYLCRRF